MKTYTNPVCEIVKFNVSDVILASGTGEMSSMGAPNTWYQEIFSNTSMYYPSGSGSSSGGRRPRS